MTLFRFSNRILSAFALSAAVAVPAQALERLDFTVASGGKDLKKAIQSNSLLQAAKIADETAPNDLLATAQADYGRILETLYGEGYYSAVIHIYIDGREAASIGPFAAPSVINVITVVVEPGRLFHFGETGVAPLPKGTKTLPEFGKGEVARSTVVRSAVSEGITGWREAGYAKVTVQNQGVVADHRDATLDANIALATGPRVTFGDLIRTTPSAVREERIRKIANFPSGEVFSPKALEAVAERLRKTGAFSSVSLREAKTLGPGDTLDVELTVADEKPHRFGAGAELSSFDGLMLSGFWMHRNLLGGAERFRIDGKIS
ncbi:MAG: outer membrane protein assembly factor, partial [Deltaproteobacteria bacterium]